MRVVVVSAWEPWRTSDGAVLPLHRHLHALASRHDITVLAAGSTTGRETPVDAAALGLPASVTVRWFGSARPAALDHAARRARALTQREPAHVLYVERPELLAALDDAARDADVVHLAGWGTARLAARVAPVAAVHVAVDPWRDSWDNRRLPSWRRWAAAGERHAIARHERTWYPRCSAVVVVTERDAELLRRQVPGARVVVVANGVDAGPAPVAFPLRPTLGFHGAFETKANVDGARALVEEIYPRVREHVPDVRVVLAGRNPPRELLALAGDEVAVHGTVDDIRAELDAMSVHVTWMPSGLGLKNKVLEAMAAGRPVVANERGASGIGPGAGVLVASDADDAARTIADVLRDPVRLAAEGAAARTRVLRDFTWAAAAERIERLWDEAAARVTAG